MLKILLAPILGGIIGYITNDIAIKMLFRPRKAMYIGKWHVPFTPGLIPSQKERIADSVGNVISSQLLNSDTMKKTALSEETVAQLRGKLEELADKCQKEERTVEEVLEQYVEAEKIEEKKTAVCDRGTELLTEKLEEAHLGEKMVQAVFQKLQDKLQFGAFSFLLKDGLAGLEQGAIDLVEDMIREKAPEILREEIGKTEDELLQTRICDFYESQSEKVPALIDKLVLAYQDAVEKGIDKALEVADIRKIVSDKVKTFDAVQLEQMIFGIMKKELRYIVYLGAVLGAILGCINLLVF